MIVLAYNHACIVIVLAAILVGWIGPMSVHRSVIMFDVIYVIYVHAYTLYLFCCTVNPLKVCRWIKVEVLIPLE